MTRLKFLRLRAGLTQMQLEQGTSIHRWRISMGESGDLRLTPEEQLALANFFHTTPHLLLQDVEIEGTEHCE